MEKSKSLAARAFVAISLLVGFYVLALAIGLFLISVPLLEVAFLHRLYAPKFSILACAGGFVVLWSIIPRRDKFEPPGPRLDPKDELRLFALISEVASKTNQAMPEEVYLVIDANAWVAQRGGSMGVAGKRVMGLGLPLLQALTVDQFRAVLAHEFGHYYGGDTKLGPWIYKTRSAIGRTLQNLGEKSALQAPFRAYGNMFLRTTLSISRQQEFSADALSASVYGAKTMQVALRRVRDAALTFPPYFQGDLLPLLNRGYRPPIGEGFGRFMSTPEVAQKLESSFETEMNAKLANPDAVFDSHPPMPMRLRALEELPDLPPPGDNAPSATLLENIEQSEMDLLLWLSGNKELTAKLTPMTWASAPDVYLDSYRKFVKHNAEMLNGVTPLVIPDIFAGSPDRLKPLRNLDGDPVPPDDRPGVCLFLFGAAISVTLVERGWKLRAEPGVFTFTNGDQNAHPFELLTKLARKELTVEGWHSACDRLGITESALGETVTNPETDKVPG